MNLSLSMGLNKNKIFIRIMNEILLKQTNSKIKSSSRSATSKLDNIGNQKWFKKKDYFTQNF